MKLTPILIPALLVVTACFFACSKSGNGSKPSISIKSITTTVDVGANFDAILTFNAKAGTLQGGNFYAIRNRINEIPLPPSATPVDTFPEPIPNFPDYTKGDFHFFLPYTTMHESDHINDTIIFNFFVIDKNGKSSDTLKSPKIVVINP